MDSEDLCTLSYLTDIKIHLSAFTHKTYFYGKTDCDLLSRID